MGLLKPGLTDSAIIAGMAKHPVAIERPIAANGNRAALGRPAERILDTFFEMPQELRRQASQSCGVRSLEA